MLKCSLLGHLGGDAELKSSNGNYFVTFRVAHSNRWTGADGVYHDESIWVDCVINGKPAVFDYLKKGQQVYVEGSVSLRVYSSQKDRCLKAGITINVRNIELVGGKSDDIPGKLFNPVDNTEHVVTKHYHCHDYQTATNPGQRINLISRSGNKFIVDADGWVFVDNN